MENQIGRHSLHFPDGMLESFCPFEYDNGQVLGDSYNAVYAYNTPGLPSILTL